MILLLFLIENIFARNHGYVTFYYYRAFLYRTFQKLFFIKMGGPKRLSRAAEFRYFSPLIVFMTAEIPSGSLKVPFGRSQNFVRHDKT